MAQVQEPCRQQQPKMYAHFPISHSAKPGLGRGLGIGKTQGPSLGTLYSGDREWHMMTVVCGCHGALKVVTGATVLSSSFTRGGPKTHSKGQMLPRNKEPRKRAREGMAAHSSALPMWILFPAQGWLLLVMEREKAAGEPVSLQLPSPGFPDPLGDTRGSLPLGS